MTVSIHDTVTLNHSFAHCPPCCINEVELMGNSEVVITDSGEVLNLGKMNKNTGLRM